MTNAVRKIGARWCGKVVCFQDPKRRLACTLVDCWEPGHRECWLILTDLGPEHAQVVWYSLRAWIECGFKALKRGGWQWQQTRMTDPERANRLWLAMAVATLWVISVGGEADAMLPASSLEALPPTHVARRWVRRKAHVRPVSCFRRGLLILATLIQGDAWSRGPFLPEPWPGEPGAAGLARRMSPQTRISNPRLRPGG